MALTAPFSRPSTALQSSLSGVAQLVGINVPRNAHYLNGVLQPPLIENAATNSNPESWDLSAWTNAGATVAFDVGITGDPNTASIVTDSSAGTFQSRQIIIPIANDNATHAVGFLIKKDNDQTRYPTIRLQIGAIQRNANVDTKTGAASGSGNPVSQDGNLVGYPGWWYVTFNITNATAGATLVINIYPAAKLTLAGADNAAAVGSVTIGYLGVELNKNIVSSPIITHGAIGVRAADVDQLISVTSRGYARVNGDFITDGFSVAQPLTPIGFIDYKPKTIISVSSKEILTRPPPATVETLLAGRQLSSVYAYASVGAQSLAPDVRSIDLKKDTTSGVLINANDSAQAAAHPNTKAAAVGRGDTTKRKQYVIKNATEIAGKIVREDLH